MTQYIPATLEEIERRLADSPKGIDGQLRDSRKYWPVPIKILAVRTGQITDNVLITSRKVIAGKERWVPVESLKIQETKE